MLTMLFSGTFRNTPSWGCNKKGNNIIDVIEEGELVEYLDEHENGWAKIKYKKVTGYVLTIAIGVEEADESSA
jgi:uncharacterized protein YgiM (DUF1202 family)